MRAYLIVRPGADLTSLSGVDALVFDRPPSSRASGEATTARETNEGVGTRLLVRVAGIDAPDLDAGLAALAHLRPDAIVLPARHGRDVAHLGARLAVLEAEHGLPDGGIGIVVLLTCAAGVLAAESFVGASTRLRGLGWDAAALAGKLGMPDGPRQASPVLAQARVAVRLAAAAAGIEAIETAFCGDDAERFRAHVAAALRDGFGAVVAHSAEQAEVIRGPA